MKNLIVALGVFVLAAGIFILFVTAGVVAVGQAPQAPASLKAIPAQGYTPESWVLTADAPDRLLLCAAPKGGGTLACRTAGEFRTWVRERQSGK